MSQLSVRDTLPGATAMDPFGVRVQASGDDRNLTSLPVPALRELVRTHRLVLLRGFTGPVESEELAAWCHQWGEVMSWPFGDVLELREADTPTDHIFDSTSVPLHWDGMYKPYIPEFQVFQCVDAPGADDGGRTVFSDTVRLLEEAPEELRETWGRVTCTYRIRNVVHYGGQAVSPLVVPHPVSGVPTLRFNAPPPADEPEFLNRMSLSVDGVAPEEVPGLLAGLDAALHDPRYFYGHTWRSGDVVLTDNYGLLHGRERFISRAPRYLRRVHLLGTPPFTNPAVA